MSMMPVWVVALGLLLVFLCLAAVAPAWAAVLWAVAARREGG